jgi:hypothetical protein
VVLLHLAQHLVLGLKRDALALALLAFLHHLAVLPLAPPVLMVEGRREAAMEGEGG